MFSYFQTSYQNSGLSKPVPWPWWTAAIVAVVIAMGWGHEIIWSGVVLFGFWCLIGLVGWGVLRVFKLQHQLNHWAEQVAVSSIVGLAFLLLIWLTSFYIFKSSWPGTIVGIVVAAGGLVIALRQKSKSSSLKMDGLLFFILLIALGLGLYQHYGIEIESGDWVQFFGAWRGDLQVHTGIASLIQEQGLPLVDVTGSSMVRLKGPAHIGSMILMAGLSDLSQLNLFQSSRVLSILAYALIVCSTFSLIWKKTFSVIILIGSALSALIWGSLSLPFDFIENNWAGLLMPFSKSIFHPNCPSASLVHNFTQLYTVVFGFGALVALKKYTHYISGRWLAFSALFFGLTYLVKPSLTILATPGLFLFLIGRRAEWKDWLIVIGCLSFTIGLFYLPYAYDSILPEKNNWGLNSYHKMDQNILVEYLVYLGVSILVLENRYYRIISRLFKKQSLDVTDYMMIVVGGGLLFALLFCEPGRLGHRNQFWGLASAMILSAPLIFIACYEHYLVKPSITIHAFFWKRALTIMIGLQLLCGLIYAIGYPYYDKRLVYVQDRDALIQLNKQTKPDTKFLLDPDMGDIAWGKTYLGRTILWDYTSIPHSKKQAQKWERINDDKGDVSAYLDHYGAIVIGFNTRWIKPQLIERKWVNYLNMREHREVWIKPTQLRVPREKD